MLDLLKELSETEKKLTEELAQSSTEELFHEILAQYKNLEVYKPQSVRELNKTSRAIIGSAYDLIRAVEELERRLNQA